MTGYNSNFLESSQKYSYQNKDWVQRSGSAGCVFCMSVFTISDITKWKDDGKTALCPHCQSDTVIPDRTCLPIKDKDFLREMRVFWFGPIRLA